MKARAALWAGSITLLSAITANAVTLDDVVVHGPMAVRMQEKNELSVAWAEKLAKHCIADAAAHQFGVSVAIIDQFGTVIYYYRADGQSRGATESALNKAKTVFRTHRASKAAQNAVYSGASSDAKQAVDGNTASEGALPIVVDNQYLGAIGVGGTAPNPPTWTDEICANNALTAVLGPQPPLLPDVPRPGGH